MIAIASVAFMGCRPQQPVVVVHQPATQPSTTISQTAVDETFEVPCFVADCDEWFRASASRRAPVNQINTLATAILRSANQQMQQKLASVIRQVTRDYFNQMDIDAGSTVASHIEGAADRVVRAQLNEVREFCRRQTRPDEQGMIIMYIGIKVSKQAVAQALSNEVQRTLSQEEQNRMRFDHQEFRNDAFGVFEKDRSQSFDDFRNQR